jgi:hypothetical protein
MPSHSLPSTAPSDIAQTLRRTWDRPQLRALENLLPLPETWQQYVLACLVIGVVVGGLVLHIMLSVQIAEADFQVRTLRQEVSRIDRVNSELVYQIAQGSNLRQMAQFAVQQGYVPATERTYVVRQTIAQPTDLATPPPTFAAGPGDWLAPARQWWEQTQQSAADALAQFQRDVSGRVK